MNKKIVIIWSEGFPFKLSASNEKNYLLAKSLLHLGIDFIIISKQPFSNWINQGVFNGVKFLNFGRKTSCFKIISYSFAIFSEIKYLIRLKSKSNQVFLLASYIFFPVYFSYALILKMFNIKLVLNIMEWHIAVTKEMSVDKKINAYFFDNFAYLLSSGAIVISDFIKQKLSKQKESERIIVVPALVDYQRIEKISSNIVLKRKYILYCGSIGYLDVIELIISSFELCYDLLDIDLVLILHGSIDKVKNLKMYLLKKDYKEKVFVYSDLQYETLINYYKNAEILLMPLRNTEQDIARYPQKIAEYASCGRPVVSNPIGQVAIDFKNKYDIIFTDDYSPESIAKSVTDLMNNKNLSEQISINIKTKGEIYFDYLLYSEKIHSFLNQL